MCNRRHNKQDLHLPYIILYVYVCISVRAYVGRMRSARLVTKSY